MCNVIILYIIVCPWQILIGEAGADPGGSLGSRDPPPEIYQGSQKNDVLV